MSVTLAERRPPRQAPTSPAAAPAPLTEAQLSALWRGRRFPAGALVTRAGVPVNVIFQGRPGRGPGPDFRGAVIAGPSGLPLRGDVELHVRSSSFREHGHDRDPAYASIILHVVFDDDTGAGTPLFGGGVAPVVALAPWVTRRAGDLQRWLAQPLLWREPCHDAVIRMGIDGAAAALDAEGDRRLAARTARYAAAVAAHGIEQTLYEGVMEAMGFGGNAAPMLALARLVPWRVLRAAIASAPDPRLRAEALLLGAAGLLPEGPVGSAMDAARWKLWGMRPANMPARRIAACAALFAAAPPSALLASLRAPTITEALRPFTAAGRPGGREARSIGRSRALEIIVNVLVPVAIASGDAAGDAALAAGARALYERLPRPASYGATRFIEQALAAEGIPVPVNARRAQGLLALHRDCCSENGCGRCPLS